jgi:uncharacterized protein YjiS (DUF1127 family)
MKPTSYITTTPSPFAALTPTLGAIWHRIKRSAANLVHVIQLARMAEALNKMSDQQLAQIGITRAQIMQHAEKLVSYEYDGL